MSLSLIGKIKNNVAIQTTTTKLNPGYARFTGNELADSLAKTETTLPSHVPNLLAPVIAKISHTRYKTWRRNLSHNSLSSARFLRSRKLVGSKAFAPYSDK